MIKRIKTIIEREKQHSPTKNGLVLFIKRVCTVLKTKAEDLQIVLTKNGTFSKEAHMYMCSLFPQKALDVIIKELKPQSVLDVGCGVGLSLNYFIENNVNATGIENSSIAISKSLHPNNIIKHNLNKPINLHKQFDMVWCFEVIEHIHPNYEATFLQTLVNHSQNIVLSCAVPGQGGHGHFNEQPRAYWIQKFNDLGYKYNEAFSNQLIATNDLYCENLMYFNKQ